MEAKLWTKIQDFSGDVSAALSNSVKSLKKKSWIKKREDNVMSKREKVQQNDTFLKCWFKININLGLNVVFYKGCHHELVPTEVSTKHAEIKCWQNL